jgi:single-strand DNA-binding protein
MSNTIILLGHVGQAPKRIDLTDASKSLVKFSVAAKEPSSKKGDDKTQWFEVEAWNGNSENALNYITRGREIQVTGRLTLNTYTAKDGTTKVVPVVKMSGFQLCGKKPDAAEVLAD